MKNVIVDILLAAIIISGVTASAYAGDTISLSFSCSIPSIPGVNAPANAQPDIEDDAEPALEETSQAEPQETDANAPAVTWEELGEETMVAMETGRQTVYTR